MIPRLAQGTLSRLPSTVLRPCYDRDSLRCGIVHIGLGAFHRAHQAPLLDALADDGDLRWGVIGASLRSAAVRDALSPQDFLYSLAVEDGADRCTRIVGTLREILVGPADRQKLVDAIASPDTHIVTVTVSEKGYKLDPSSGALLKRDQQVRGDLLSLKAPSSLPGFLAAGLKRRKDETNVPLTIISCDNMEANGQKLRSSVVDIARAHDCALAEWINEKCSFPSTMVDRIVPATTEADITRTASELGVMDRAPVRTEPFSQWVIENRFSGPRPELERYGVIFASDVAPWERAKLRMLNGAHSTMAYIGGLAGIATVDAVVAQSWGQSLIHGLWDELGATLTSFTSLDLHGYRDQLMRRFRNAALNHRLVQIATDGSQKLPQRIVAPTVELLDAGYTPMACALAIAAWIRWVAGVNDRGEEIIVNDPLSSTMRRLVDSGLSAGDQVSAMLSITSVFPERLRGDRAFKQLVVHQLESLQRLGAVATVQNARREHWRSAR